MELRAVLAELMANLASLDFVASLDLRTEVLYNMKRFTAAEARQQFSLLLDTAERGEAVIIERRGVRFRIRTERQPASRATARRTPVIEFVDPSVADGQWSWDWRPEGLHFVAAKRGRR